MNNTICFWVLLNGRTKSKTKLSQASNGDTVNREIINIENNISGIKATYYSCKQFGRFFESDGEYVLGDNEGVAIEALKIIINQGVATRSHSLIKNMENILKSTIFINPPDSLLV